VVDETIGSGEAHSPLGGDRDAAVMRVQDAFAQGAISHQDLERRLHAVLTAQTSDDELPGRASSAGPLIRISGSMEFGRLTVRHSRL